MLLLGLFQIITNEKMKVKIDGQRIIVYSESFCGSKKINPKTDFNFQLKLNGQISVPIHFDTIKNPDSHDIMFEKNSSEVFSNFSLRAYNDTPSEYDVVLVQDGGSDDSLIGCDKKFLPHVLPSKETTEQIQKNKII